MNSIDGTSTKFMCSFSLNVYYDINSNDMIQDGSKCRDEVSCNDVLVVREKIKASAFGYIYQKKEKRGVITD